MPFPQTHPTLAKALDARGYHEPTPVQSAILAAPAGTDLLVSAQTGSGKTVAFGLAAADTLLGEAETFEPGAAPLALVIAPTRELALQVAGELAWLYAPAGAKVVTCVGGMNPREERFALAAGAHMVVGTPGRLRDHLERGNLDLAALKVVVLDEADEMLDMGFREDLEEILDSTPAERRTLLFSATIAPAIASLARRYQRDAFRIDTARRDEPHGDIDYRAIRVAPNEVEQAVVNVLRYFEAPGALIFCATRDAVRRLHSALRERGFQAVALSGELSQKERADALQALRDGHARACVATDVAARGLDLPDLGLVIHAELPQNRAALLHRSGRTGRAGKKGVSVLLVPYTQRRRAEQLLISAHLDAAWSGPPSAEEIRAKDETRLLEDPLLNDAPTDEELALARKLLLGREPEVIAAALVRLHRSRMPEPEELYDDVRDSRPSGPRERPERPERGDKWHPLGPDAVSDAAWFKIPVGRRNNADPKWLIPLICRMGHVTKKDIGSIRIFERETKFEIAKAVEARFLEAARIAGAAEGGTPVEPAIAPAADERGAPRGRPSRGQDERGPKRDFGPKRDYAKPAGGPDGPAGDGVQPKRDYGRPAGHAEPFAATPAPERREPNDKPWESGDAVTPRRDFGKAAQGAPDARPPYGAGKPKRAYGKPASDTGSATEGFKPKRDFGKSAPDSRAPHEAGKPKRPYGKPASDAGPAAEGFKPKRDFGKASPGAPDSRAPYEGGKPKRAYGKPGPGGKPAKDGFKPKRDFGKTGGAKAHGPGNDRPKRPFAKGKGKPN